MKARKVSSAGNNIELTLMAGAVKDTLNEGETKTYTIDDKDYETFSWIKENTNPDAIAVLEPFKGYAFTPIADATCVIARIWATLPAKGPPFYE